MPMLLPRTLCVLLLALAGLANSLPAPAAEPKANAFAEQLTAGEFAPALNTARATQDPTLRNERLAAIAAAQAEAGGRDEAFRTLSVMTDDLARASAIDRTRDMVPRARGGGSQADFDSLIDLIVATVRPPSWDDVGGPGSISPFQNGVYVDPQGTLARVAKVEAPRGLAAARLAALTRSENADPFARSGMRKVSLTRLEKHVQLRLAAGRPLDESMRYLAGLEKIEFILVYPESGDLVLAGPAGPWRIDDEGRPVGLSSGRPVLQLDDLVVILRQTLKPSGGNAAGTFTCSIEPRQEGLARTREVAASTASRPLKPSQRGAWLKSLRDAMGLQDIVVTGIDPETRVARVIVAADYHMKLIGMGLEPGTADVPSYLDLVRVEPGQAPPPLDVLRWWFTMNYDALATTAARDAFQIRGQGVQVLSENELLSQLGRRVQTGASSVTNQEFAGNFTQHFAALAEKNPVYADLQNVFDLALVAALIRSEGLADQVNWHLTCFGNPEQYTVARGAAPRQVESVINHRRLGGKHLIVGVSGGVRAEAWRYARREAIQTEKQGTLAGRRASAQGPADLPLDAWWWD